MPQQTCQGKVANQTSAEIGGSAHRTRITCTELMFMEDWPGKYLKEKYKADSLEFNKTHIGYFSNMLGKGAAVNPD